MQRAKTAKATKKQSQRAVSRKQSTKSQRPLRTVKFQGDATTLQYLPRHTNVAQEIMQPTRLRVMNPISHPEHGDGVRVVGRQLICSLTTTAASTDLFTGGTASTGANTIALSPDTLNGRLALLARTYSRYCFRDVTIEFVSRVPTTQAGSFVLGFSKDPAAAVMGTPTFSSVCEMSPAVQSSFITPHVVFPVLKDYQSRQTWFTEYVGATNPDLRQTVQGIIIGYPDVTSIGAVTQGFLWVDYVIDLYQPTLDMGFTITKTPQELKVLEDYRDKQKAIIASAADPREAEISALQIRLRDLKTGNINL